jgi:hypothetical protein
MNLKNLRAINCYLSVLRNNKKQVSAKSQFFKFQSKFFYNKKEEEEDMRIINLFTQKKNLEI